MLSKYTIGIDLGGTNLKIALLDGSCRIRKKHILNTSLFCSKDSLIEAITDSVLQIIDDNGLNKNRILGIGIGLPGPVDTDRGLVHFFPNIPGWHEVGLKRILEKRLGMSVFIDNDANLMALAEYKLGAARSCRNAVCLTLGTGVGGGLILEGRLFRGSSFAAGEIGHMPINEKGPECNCAGIGCLESYIGNRRILQLAKRIFKRDISLEELSSLAKNNNKKAAEIWEKVGRHLGTALVQAVNLLNPDCIVIGGGVANAGRVLFNSVEETILSRAMLVQAKAVKVVKAKLGNDAGMIGACLLVKDRKGP